MPDAMLSRFYIHPGPSEIIESVRDLFPEEEEKGIEITPYRWDPPREATDTVAVAHSLLKRLGIVQQYQKFGYPTPGL